MEWVPGPGAKKGVLTMSYDVLSVKLQLDAGHTVSVVYRALNEVSSYVKDRKTRCVFTQRLRVRGSL